MLTRMLCRLLGGHRDMWPQTRAGITTVRCSRCNRVSAGLSFGADVKPPRPLVDQRASTVVTFKRRCQ